MLTGGCFCGRLRYEIHARPFNATICHCVDCRRVSGAPAVAWFSVRPDEFRVVAGTPHAFASSENVTRGFCRDCGTALTYQRADLPGEIDITTASLDEPERVPPQDQTHIRDRPDWAETAGGLPTYAGARPPATS